MPREVAEVDFFQLLAEHVMDAPFCLRLLRKFSKPKLQQRTVHDIVQIFGFTHFLRNDLLLDFDGAPVRKLTRLFLEEIVNHELQQFPNFFGLADTEILLVSALDKVVNEQVLNFAIVPKIPHQGFDNALSILLELLFRTFLQDPHSWGGQVTPVLR